MVTSRTIATWRNSRLLTQSCQCWRFGWHLVGEASSTSKSKLAHTHNGTALRSTWTCSCR